jgi:L-seryl-tRNA(Ser) seleniumtransferase
MPTAVVAISAAGITEDLLARLLRIGDPAVLGRVQGGALLLDLRTIFPEQEDAVATAVGAAAGSNLRSDTHWHSAGGLE